MKTKGKTLNEKHLGQVQAKSPAVLYTPPQVEVIDIELTYNILTASLNDMPGDDY
ncbi:MAG: hypothetical protein QM237_05140 [Bacteroidota bacterium]|jgi:hypothetical protein|nr:hypothetical protein [Bacteroidota bacterium]HHU95703.1 hypothetical protein [Petrimonas sp.]